MNVWVITFQLRRYSHYREIDGDGDDYVHSTECKGEQSVTPSLVIRRKWLPSYFCGSTFSHYCTLALFSTSSGITVGAICYLQSEPQIHFSVPVESVQEPCSTVIAPFRLSLLFLPPFWQLFEYSIIKEATIQLAKIAICFTTNEIVNEQV